MLETIIIFIGLSIIAYQLHQLLVIKRKRMSLNSTLYPLFTEKDIQFRESLFETAQKSWWETNNHFEDLFDKEKNGKKTFSPSKELQILWEKRYISSETVDILKRDYEKMIEININILNCKITMEKAEETRRSMGLTLAGFDLHLKARELLEKWVRLCEGKIKEEDFGFK
jgi:hypothetical protein